MNRTLSTTPRIRWRFPCLSLHAYAPTPKAPRPRPSTARPSPLQNTAADRTAPGDGKPGVPTSDETEHPASAYLEVARSELAYHRPAHHVEKRRKEPTRVVVETVLPCPADVAWQEVRKSRLLREVCFPLVMFGRTDGEHLPYEWHAGESIQCRSYLLGLIPLGRRRIEFERIDDAARELQSRESDPIVARWDHLIRITPVGRFECLYRDEIVIDAGWRTGLVAWFARRFYHHRQKRWQSVALRLKASEICRLARAA